MFLANEKDTLRDQQLATHQDALSLGHFYYATCKRITEYRNIQTARFVSSHHENTPSDTNKCTNRQCHNFTLRGHPEDAAFLTTEPARDSPLALKCPRDSPKIINLRPRPVLPAFEKWADEIIRQNLAFQNRGHPGERSSSGLPALRNTNPAWMGRGGLWGKWPRRSLTGDINVCA